MGIVRHIPAQLFHPFPNPFLVNVRHAKSFRNGTSLALILPADWVRGNDLRPGDKVELAYDDVVHVRPLKLKSASAAGGSNPGGPARRPVQPAKTDEGVLADAGG